MKIFKPEEDLKKKIFSEKQKKDYHVDYIENMSVFGVDIYKYSEYPEDVQIYVPVLFNSIYRLTAITCLNKEAFFFKSYASTYATFKTKFISTGDGGFQIFDNPLQAILFGAYFELNVRRFNSGSYVSNLNKNLFNIIDRIELRYCITRGKIYNYDRNFFGAGIINNSRILAKDNLNRLLIDNNTLRWFDNHLNTIENLIIMKKSNFLELTIFKGYDKKLKTMIFDNNEEENIIKSLDVLKIGSIKSKNTDLDIYNLKIQFILHLESKGSGFEKKYKSFLYTIGNLNTQGIQ